MTAPPAISEYLDLTLTNGFFKTPLDSKKVKGHLIVNNGVIEELVADMGKKGVLNISTNGDQMLGNVFKYLDDNGDEQSAMIYESPQDGKYMVTLSTGSFQGLRLEFANEQALEKELANNNPQEEQSALSQEEASPGGELVDESREEQGDGFLNEDFIEGQGSGQRQDQFLDDPSYGDYYKVSEQESTFKAISQ